MADLIEKISTFAVGNTQESFEKINDISSVAMFHGELIAAMMTLPAYYTSSTFAKMAASALVLDFGIRLGRVLYRGLNPSHRSIIGAEEMLACDPGLVGTIREIIDNNNTKKPEGTSGYSII